MNKTNKSENNKGNGNNIPRDHGKVSRNKPRQFIGSIFTSILKKKHPQKKKDKRNNDEKIRLSEKRNRRFQNWGVVLNLIMITIFAFSVFYQVSLTRKSINLSESAFNMAKISVSRDSVMRISDTLAKNRTIKMEFRAYLSIVDFEIISFSPGKQFKYKIHLQNTGKTPAQKINVFAGSKQSRPDVFINDFDTLNKSNPIISSGTTGGNIELIINVFPDIVFTENDITKIKTGEDPLYILGIINYEDDFGDKHYTRYCRQVIYDSVDTFRFIYYKNHNEEK